MPTRQAIHMPTHNCASFEGFEGGPVAVATPESVPKAKSQQECLQIPREMAKWRIATQSGGRHFTMK